MDNNAKQATSLKGDGPELQRDANADPVPGLDGRSSSPSQDSSHPLSTINPLADTTTTPLEEPRPAIASTSTSPYTGAEADAQESSQQLERPPIPSREGRRSFRIDHPYSSLYGLSVIEDQSESTTQGMTATEQPTSACIIGPLGTGPGIGTELSQDRGEGKQRSDGTWNSNTLTLASNSEPPRMMKGEAIYGREQTDKIQMDWEDTWERQKKERWQGKVRKDLEGWRGGHGYVFPRARFPNTSAVSNSRVLKRVRWGGRRS